MLDPDHGVVVTREEHHQAELGGWAPADDGRSRHVAVELVPATIGHGAHLGQPGVEVRLAPRAVPQPAPQPVTQSAPAAPADDCHPNYGGCVPIASDVDCQGGSGNGPAYVRGPVRVTGADVYGLDADGDGTGCDT